jgi:hypothetical protein
MRYIFFLSSLLFGFASCSPDRDTSYEYEEKAKRKEALEREAMKKAGMRDPEAVAVDHPVVAFDTLVPDSFFLVMLSDNLITVKYEGNTYHPETFRQLSRLVREKGGDQLEGKVALTSGATGYRRVDSTINVLKENNVHRFNLITDLDDHP